MEKRNRWWIWGPGRDELKRLEASWNPSREAKVYIVNVQIRSSNSFNTTHPTNPTSQALNMSAFLRPVFGAAARPAVRSFSSTSARGVARVQIIGNLADTPEVRATSTGREMIKYAVASNSGPRSDRVTSWFNITSFVEGKARDFLLTLPKGCVTLAPVV